MTEAYTNPDVCQACARCCKEWWIYTDLKDDAIRASWLDTDKVSVVKIRDGLWKIVFHIPCKQLTWDGEKYFCKKHKGTRPDYCRTYPTNFRGASKEEIDDQAKLCQIIKMVV